MRSDTQMYFDETEKSQSQNIIIQTRKMIKGMPEHQRFKKALQHVNDGLDYRPPRPDAYGPNLPKFFQFAYKVQTSQYWSLALFICSYLYMYTIILQPEYEFIQKVVIQLVCLSVFWFDTVMFLYHKSFQTIKISSKYEFRFFIKIVIVFLLTLDVFIFIGTSSAPLRAMRPFSILRAFLPIFYDSITRKNFYALIAAYKDILVFLSFYAIIIISFALVSNQMIDVPADYQFDQYSNNYRDFFQSLYVTYALSSYDSYPDNQIASIKWNVATYAIFIVFIFFNMFFFTTIPATLILNSFRQTRSKQILVDEIRQQNSLILAFVSLGQQNYNLNSNTLIRFLLFMYKQKARYVNCITQICMRLDQNNNGTIQISEFMQLCKILTQKSQLMPPEFHDWKAWIRFRQWLVQLTHLQDLVKNYHYRLITNLIIVLAVINCIAYLLSQIYIFRIFDNIFIGIFVFDLVLRIIGIGPQNYFRDQWNYFDAVLILIITILQITPDQMIPKNTQVLLKIFRIFRVTTLIKVIRGTNIKSQSFLLNQSLYARSRRLISQISIIMPIMLKFLPFFLISFYLLGTIGMQIFYSVNNSPETIYKAYSQFSNFSYFMGTQFIMVQTMVQAGWSTVCYDYVVKTGSYYPTVLFFVCLHIIIVLILASLLKGIVWQVYFTVHEQFDQKVYHEIKANERQYKIYIKRQQYAQIRQIIEQNGYIVPNSIVKRQFLQNKLDIQIFKRLKQLYEKRMINHNNKPVRRAEMIGQIVLEKKQYLIGNLDDSQLSNQSLAMHQLYDRVVRRDIQDQDLDVIEEEDFEEEMEQLMNKLVLHPKTKFSQTCVYPKALLDLLQQKMVKPFGQNSDRAFNLNNVPFINRDGIQFFTFTLNRLLQIQTSKRDQKMLIIKNMADHQLITDQQAKQLFAKGSNQKNHTIDVNWIIRKMFLHDTNEQLINNFEVEYFSDIYGQSFKQINKVTIQPLLKYEALLTYNLRSILRYPQVQTNNFFQLLTKIQDRISNNLLKKGSLFKFVYQIQSLTDNWFTVQFKDSQQVSIHFIKSGIWIYSKKMQENQIYYARDMFKWNTKGRSDKMTCQKILKMLYQTFEGLAFGLLNQNQFFSSNPVQNVYDVYSFFVDVSKKQRLVERKLQITKVMLVVLTKEEQRFEGQHLQYDLSEIAGFKRRKKNVDFKFDESQRQTFDKLKNFAALDHQRIISSQGLPFSYVLNLMTQVKQILQLYSGTFVNQVQKVLNQEFQNQ